MTDSSTFLRRNPGRGATSGAALAAVIAALLLAACGGGNEALPAAPDPEKASASLKASASGELTAFLQNKLRERARQRAAGLDFAGAGSVAVLPVGAAAPATSNPPAYSRTLTQENGVDEADLLKTDGTHLYSMDARDAAAPRLNVHRREANGDLSARATLALAKGDATAYVAQGLMLSADARVLAAGGETWSGIPGGQPCVGGGPCPGVMPGPIWVRNSVVVQRIDIADPDQPRSTERLEFDGRWIDARRVGDHLVLVSEYRPMLAVDQLPVGTSAADLEAAIARTRAADVLPRLRTAAGERPLVDETQCWVHEGNAAIDIAFTTITVLDLRANDLAPSSRCFLGGTEALYMTESTLYLASTRWPVTILAGGALRYEATMKTDLHKFGFAGGALSYRASGSVPGSLGWDAQRKSYRLSEYAGDLRVLSFTGELGWAALGDAGTTPASPATLSVLREDVATRKLQSVAALPNPRRPQALGKPGEQVHGVRFAGSRGYLVTFRQVDPLYVLDLSDAADPKVSGVLEVPGFSDHLFPLAGDLLLGVGRDVSAGGRAGGVKVSLFDVADAAQPRELHSLRFGEAGSTSALDSSRHGMSLLQQGSNVRIGLPMQLFDLNFTQLRNGLQRLEVDLAARALTARPWIAPAAGGPNLSDLSLQRSTTIGAQIYWLREGALSRHDW